MAGSLVDPSYLALVNDQTLRSTIIAGRPDWGMPDSADAFLCLGIARHDRSGNHGYSRMARHASYNVPWSALCRTPISGGIMNTSSLTNFSFWVLSAGEWRGGGGIGRADSRLYSGPIPQKSLQLQLLDYARLCKRISRRRDAPSRLSESEPRPWTDKRALCPAGSGGLPGNAFRSSPSTAPIWAVRFTGSRNRNSFCARATAANIMPTDRARPDHLHVDYLSTGTRFPEAN